MSQEERATETATITITGMTCDNCARRVERALRGLAGVKDANVDRINGLAIVKFDRTQVDIAAMHAAVLKAGYQALMSPPA